MSQFQLVSTIPGVDRIRSDFEFGNNESGDERSYNVSCASSTTEEQGSQEEEYIAGTFEGPEKTMDVVFYSPPYDVSSTSSTVVEESDSEEPRALGLRALSRSQLDHLCRKAKCTIMSKISNKHMDAYVLSESSLFVYSHRLVMKTCGTTTLLRCLSTLLQYADELGLVLSWVGYSRKNFLYPTAQMWPHTNFGDEMRYISTHEKLQHRLGGEGYILGPVTGDHWFVYVAENLQKSKSPTMITPPPPPLTTDLMRLFSEKHGCGSVPRLLHDHHSATYRSEKHGVHYRTINLMMFDMAPETASIFFQSVNHFTGKQMTERAGIQALCPGATIDEQSFQPCGYSMNAILHDAYSTIHVTPEAECSYASFETNTRLSTYCPLVRQVLAVFQPKRFVLTLFGDHAFMNSLRALPTDKRFINLPLVGGGYRRTSVSNTKIEQQGQGCVMACYSLEKSDPSALVAPDVATEAVLLANIEDAEAICEKATTPPATSPALGGRRERAYSYC